MGYAFFFYKKINNYFFIYSGQRANPHRLLLARTGCGLWGQAKAGWRARLVSQAHTFW